MSYLKRKEAAARLGISESAILRLVADGQLTPFIYFHNKIMYGLQVSKSPFHIAGTVWVTGLLHPPMESLIEFLHRGIDNEIHYAPFFIASEKCKPEISPVDIGYGDAPVAIDVESIYPSRSGFPWDAGRGALITTADDIASMDLLEPTQSVDEEKTDGYPVRLEAFVYLELEVESIAGPKASEKPKGKLSVFKGMDPGEVTIEFTPNNRLTVSIKNETKKVNCSDLDLIDNRTGDLNKQGKLLLEHCTSQTRIPKSEPNDSAMKAIKKIFRDKLKINAAPFSTDWIPHFKVIDSRDKADVRAKQRASGKHEEYDEVHTSYTDLKYIPDNELNGDPLSELLLEKVNSGEIPQNEIDKHAQYLKAGKITKKQFMEWLEAY